METDLLKTLSPVSFKPSYKNIKSRDKKDAVSEETELTPEERKKLEKQEQAEQFKKALEEKRQQAQMLKEQLESSREEAEGMAKEFGCLSKCMVIAARISRGDIVPAKDMKYLMENEPDLYKQAILLRQPKKDPEEYDSVLDEEDEKDSGSADSLLSEPASPSFSLPETQDAAPQPVSE